MATIHANFQSLALRLHTKNPKPRSKIAQVNAALRGSSGRQLIESGTIRSIQPKEAAKELESKGSSLLDIRPEWEREKAYVPGSLHVPLFVQDMDNSVITLLKKWVHFGYIGAWTGQKFTTINSEFVSQVQGVVPDKETTLLVACGEGLRSVIAVSKLYDAGYRNIGWLAGGFNRSKDGDFPVEGSEKLQYATIGGASYYFLKIKWGHYKSDGGRITHDVSLDENVSRTASIDYDFTT